MAPLRVESCFNNILLFCIFLLALPSSSQSLTSRLIPPTSSKSPFYNNHNNIISLTTPNNITSNRNHKKYKGGGLYSEIDFNTGAGGYVMDAFIGSPPQYVFGTFDSGSEFLWFQCQGISPPPSDKGVPTFNQLMSSSYKELLCGDQRCDTTNNVIQCHNSQMPCAFQANYLDKTYGNGVMATDKVVLSTYTQGIPELKFGCSKNNTKDDVGIVGAGMGKYSFPFQLSPSDPKFSYCISFDGSKINMVKFGLEASLEGSSTTFLKNKYRPLYYMDVIGIKVNNQNIRVPPIAFGMSIDGRRGFIIDSGTTYTSLTNFIFEALRRKIAELLGAPVRYWIFDICYPPSRFDIKKIQRKPTITIQFPEFDFVLPFIGTWAKVKHANLVCLLIHNGGDENVSVLGYMQLFDINVRIDPNNSKLYLMRTVCPSSQ